MDDAVDVRSGAIDLSVDEDLGVALVSAFNFLPVQVADDNMLRPNLFEAEAMRLHQDFFLLRDAHGDMAEDVVPVTLLCEDVAGIGEIFFELFQLHNFSQLSYGSVQTVPNSLNGLNAWNHY